MIQQNSIVIKQFPSLLDAAACRRFYRELRAELADTYRPKLVFELSPVQHMTALGVDLLVRCIDQIAARDGELKLAAASPQTQLVLELTQISGVAETYDTVEEAIESWTMSAPSREAQSQPASLPQAA